LRKEARVCCRERKAAGLGGPKNSDHIDGPRANLPNEVDPDEPTRKKKKKKKKGAAAHHQAAAVRFLVVLVGQAVSSNCCLFCCSERPTAACYCLPIRPTPLTDTPDFAGGGGGGADCCLCCCWQGGALAGGPTEMRHFKDDLDAVTEEAEQLTRSDACRTADLYSPPHLHCHRTAASLWAVLSFGTCSGEY
jgi:hypothetical protein